MRQRTLVLITGFVLVAGCATNTATPAPQPQMRGQAEGQAQGQGQGQSSVWVCHGRKNPKWRRVSASAADAHRRHGDFVTGAPQQSGQRCNPGLR